MKYQQIISFARNLRKNQTPAEKLLWQLLRKRQINGYKFLRQHPLLYDRVRNELFFFIPDFYCPELRLIIEIDGEIHNSLKEKDARKDSILRSQGYTILRIQNDEVYDPQEVRRKIITLQVKLVR